MSATPIRRRRAGIGAGLAATVLVGTLGAGTAQAVTGFAFDERVAGATRLETSIAASKALYPDAGMTEDVVIVSQFSIVDGLTASYLAGLKNAPILYTETNSMAQVTQDEIKRLGVKRAWVVGGTAVISQQLEDEWKKSYQVTRFGGTDRYDTAARVARADFDATGYEPERIFIASGTRQADALAAGPIAYARGYPILLTEAGTLPAATRASLDLLKTPARTVIGGNAVVSDAVYADSGATGRLGGVDRQETAVLVAEHAVANEYFTFKNAALVGGVNTNAADALVAAPLTGATGTPLLFIEGNDAVGPRAGDYLDKHSANLDDHGYVLGGTNAVSDKAVAEATARAQ